MVFIVIVTVNQGVLDHKEQQYIYMQLYTYDSEFCETVLFKTSQYGSGAECC